MKSILAFFSSLLCQTAFAQFALVTDKDGFVNVRSSPGLGKNIIDTLSNKQIVFCLEKTGEWIEVDYGIGKNFERGYIHTS